MKKWKKYQRQYQEDCLKKYKNKARRARQLKQMYSALIVACVMLILFSCCACSTGGQERNELTEYAEETFELDASECAELLSECQDSSCEDIERDCEEVINND